MKQSTKLLSLVLALILAFSCFSVIGNAALVPAEVAYDNIDDADLTPEQVADLALDLIDKDVLNEDMGTIDLSVLGTLDLTSTDAAISSLYDLSQGTLFKMLKSIAGDLADMEFGALNGVQRAGGDLNVIYALLQFLDANKGIVSKIVYGIGTSDGITLGSILNGLLGSNFNSINDILADIPGYLSKMVFDMLLYGSYNYPNDSETLETLPTEADSLDEIVQQALVSLLLDPQDYTWDGEGEDAVKVWDTSSNITSLSDYASIGVTTEAELWAKINPMALSLFDILDNIAQPAIDKFGIPALNYNLKKGLMEACEIEFNEIDKSSIKDTSVVAAFDAEENYVNYIAYDCLLKGSDGAWYYTTLETEVVDVDEEGKEIKEKVRKYFKANMAAGNDFADMINWDWKFVTSTSSEEGTKLLYSDLINNDDDSIVGGLNWLLSKIYDTALTEETRTDYEAVMGEFVTDGGNEALGENLLYLAQYILGNFGDKIWGKDSKYADESIYNVEFYQQYDIVQIVALIGPELFEDAMPQILLPQNEEGDYFDFEGADATSETILWKFAAVVLRELFTGIAPNVNYDEFIFAEDTLTSAEGRQYAEHTPEEWLNIIVNMAMDVAYTYLANITNFQNVYTTATINGASMTVGYAGTNEIVAPTAETAVSDARWKGMLNTVIDWAVSYVGEGSTGVLAGINPTKLAEFSDPLDKLSYVFNTILPLGLVGSAYTTNNDTDGKGFTGIDLNKLVGSFEDDGTTPAGKGLVALLTNFDLTALTGLFGRNDTAGLNILGTKSLVSSVLRLVNQILNLVFGQTVLQGVQTDGATTQSITTVVAAENLQTVIEILLGALYTRRVEILESALPVVGKLMSGWGTEQEFNTPEMALTEAIDLTDGATSAAQTVEIRNESEGVWRHYVVNNTHGTDNQYVVVPVSISVTSKAYDGSAASYVTVSNLTTDDINYGGTGSFEYTVSGVPGQGGLALFDFTYKVKDENGAYLGGDSQTYSAKQYVWLNYNRTDAGTEDGITSDAYYTYVYSPQYVGLSNIADNLKNIDVASFRRKNVTLGATDQAQWVTPSNANRTKDGISMGTAGFDGTIETNDIKTSISNWTAPYKNVTSPLTGSNYAVGDRKPSMATANKDYDQIRFTLFANGSFTIYDTNGENSRTFNVTDAAFDEAAFNATNKQSGDSTTWDVYCGIKKTEQETHDFKLIYLDDIYRAKLQSLVEDELSAVRLETEYNTTGTSYANEILENEDSTDSKGETVLRETNFGDTGVNPDTNEEVTVITNATAWATYQDALIKGARGARQALRDDGYTVYNFRELYEALRVAANDVQYLRKNAEEIAATAGANDINGTIDALKAQLIAAEAETTDVYDYTDYRMYRLNRFNEAREDIQDYINLKKDASYANVGEIDGDFHYNYMNKADLKALVTGNENYDIIMALVETLDEEALADRAQWLSDKKSEYGRVNFIDLKIISNILDLTEERLLKRDGAGTYTQHLQAEIDSANNQIGKTNTGYTETSWNNYIEALEYAEEIVQGDSQKLMFDAKYNLLVERKELVKVEDEGDYTELVTLMEQARQALANQDLYNNTAKEFGQVLAELGMDPVMHADGYEVQLFPGSAELVLAEGYGAEDQHKIDRAATALKEALARLEFASKTVTGATVEKMVIVEGNEEEGIEEVAIEKAAIVDANLTPDDVKEYFTVTADGEAIVKENITVSRDVNYTVETDSEMGLAGTNSTVTFYKDVEGVKIPVLTFKLIVKGDINGDGTVDVLDAAYGALVANDKTDLSGCYLLAGDMADDDKIVGTADYSAIVNKAVA